MKTKSSGGRIVMASVIAHVGALLAAFALLGMAIEVRAQDGTVTISGAEFQQLVYAAHAHPTGRET